MSFRAAIADRNESWRRVVLAVLWLTLFAYLAQGAWRGWIPHDEGLLGQTAERVLQGELPHRDFDDPYTGGLSFLHALAFKILGVELTSPRTVLLFFSALFVVALYRVARRFAAPFAALLTTVLAVAWSLPIYFAALPSWYNLFCAVFGLLALCKFIESDARRWLFVAGLCGGTSFLFKSIGLFYIAAVLLFLLYREATIRRATMVPGETASRGDTLGWWLFVGAGLLTFSLLLVELLSHRPSAFRVLLFLLPAVVICAFLLWHEGRGDGGRLTHRLRALLVMAWPFIAGVLLPIAVFLLPYVLTQSVEALLYGVFVLPRKRFELPLLPLPPLWTALTVLPVATLLGWTAWRRQREGSRAVAALAVVGCGLVLFWGDRPAIYRVFWDSTRPLVPAVVLLGCWLLLRHDRSPELGATRRQQLFLVLAMTACVSLVQLDNVFGIYFAYTAPVVILAVLAILSVQGDLEPLAPPCRRAARRGWAGIATVYLLFAVLWVHRGLVLLTGIEYRPVEQRTVLQLERGGLEITAPMTRLYGELVEAVSELSPPGSFIYATPDCPEVYFLTARRNPTRTFFDLFDQDSADPAARSVRILRLLAEHDVKLVVLNEAPLFSGEVDPALEREIRRRYPRSTRIGPFTLHW